MIKGASAKGLGGCYVCAYLHAATRLCAAALRLTALSFASLAPEAPSAPHSHRLPPHPTIRYHPPANVLQGLHLGCGAQRAGLRPPCGLRDRPPRVLLRMRPSGKSHMATNLGLHLGGKDSSCNHRSPVCAARLVCPHSTPVCCSCTDGSTGPLPAPLVHTPSSPPPSCRSTYPPLCYILPSPSSVVLPIHASLHSLPPGP